MVCRRVPQHLSGLRWQVAQTLLETRAGGGGGGGGGAAGDAMKYRFCPRRTSYRHAKAVNRLLEQSYMGKL